uniref:Unc-93 homolog A n=1 Tax=Oryctolagus cuniculus TaxID=9986 RepID=A0A5F9C4W5_RABIT
MEPALRNILVVSSGFLLLFTAYGGLQNLQSSLHSEAGLGVATLGTLYGGVLLSSTCLPPLLIRKLGCKWTMAVSMCGYVAFSLGNFHASWYGSRPRPGAPGSLSRLPLAPALDGTVPHPGPHTLSRGGRPGPAAMTSSWASGASRGQGALTPPCVPGRGTSW